MTTVSKVFLTWLFANTFLARTLGPASGSVAELPR